MYFFFTDRAVAYTSVSVTVLTVVLYVATVLLTANVMRVCQDIICTCCVNMMKMTGVTVTVFI